MVEIEGLQILYPNFGEVEPNVEINLSNLVLIPKNSQFGRDVEVTFYVPNMYKNVEPTNDFVSTLYHNRVSKFAQRKLFAELYDGDIAGHQNQKLNSITKIFDDSMIRLASSWTRKQKNSYFSQFSQHGQAVLAYNIDISMNKLENIITSQLCSGTVITMQYVGDCGDEFSTHYYQHEHDNTIDCDSNNCVLSEILDNNDVLPVEYISTFIASISQKQNAFVEQFLKNINFNLFSPEYTCEVNFYLNGSARLSGLLWTQNCTLLNEQLSEASLKGNIVDKQDYLDYIDNTILTTVNKINIRDNLRLSDEEATKIANFGVKYQVDLNMKPEYLPMPSYITMLKIKPKDTATSNIQMSKRFLEVIKRYLLELSDEEKNSLTTEEWLRNLSIQAKFKPVNDVQIDFQFETTDLSFLLEERLENLLTKYGSFIGKFRRIKYCNFTKILCLGLYHYCLSCSVNEDSIVLRRLRILDCFTTPYNATILKAFEDKVEIVPLFSIREFWEFQDKFEENLPNFEDTEIFGLLSNHFLGPLTELYSLSDPKRIRDLKSSPIEYISTYEDHKPKFRKVSVPSEDTYELPGRGFFKKLSSNILRHFGRLNGQNLLLVETSLCYDVLRQKDADEILQLYKEKLDKIPDGEIVGVYGQKLPLYVICDNNQILKLREAFI